MTAFPTRQKSSPIHPPRALPGRSPPAPAASCNPAQLLDVKALASLLAISPRHVRRLADSGQLPRPLSLGRSRRWRLIDIMALLEGRS